MPDWTKSMQQSYEYYTVEPTTLADVKRLDNVKKAKFSRDSESDTLGSATIDVTNSVGEAYIRCYLKTIQNGVTEKTPLGMVLSQTPSSSFNGKILDVSMDCYTPLIELKEKKPPLGYTIRKGTRIMDAVYRIVRENARVPVNKVEPNIKKSKNLLPLADSGIYYNGSIAGGRPFISDKSVSISDFNNINISSYRGVYAVIKLTEGKTYTLTVNNLVNNCTTQQIKLAAGFRSSESTVFGTNEIRNCVVSSDYNPSSFTFTVPSGYPYCLVGLFNYPTVSGDTISFNAMQLELGTTATDYEEYFEPIDLSPTLQHDFVANTDDTWLTFVIDLIANAKYELGLGERGDILFLPKQDMASLQPVWTYDDDNSSILYPELTMDHDLYGIPNVVEVIYSYGSDYKQAVAKNEDVNSPISIPNRGREIIHRVTDPSLAGYVTQDQIQDYAERLLKELSTIEYTVSYTHAYCPVRIGDCVRLNYTRAGIKDIKAKVISQSISCEPGCPVSEKAVFTSKLWR